MNETFRHDKGICADSVPRYQVEVRYFEYSNKLLDIERFNGEDAAKDYANKMWQRAAVQHIEIWMAVNHGMRRTKAVMRRRPGAAMWYAITGSISNVPRKAERSVT